MTDAPIDPNGLLASGVELATEPELARLLGVSRTALGPMLRGRLYRAVRFVRVSPGASGVRYSVEDARAAIEPYRSELEARRARHAERQAADQAAAAARRAAKAAPSKGPSTRGARAKPTPAPHAPAPRAPVEVLVRRRPGGVTRGA